MTLRQKFGVVSLIITLPILGYLLRDHGADWLTLALIMVALIPAFFANLSDSILASVPRLHQDIKPLQRNHVEVSIGRLLLSGVFLVIFPFTFIAVFANSLPRIYGNIKLRKMASRFADMDEKPDPQKRKEIMHSVKRTMPIVIYYCISGQLSIWLISFFGSTTSISQLGALSRLAMMFTVVSSLFATLVVPRFSRMEDDWKRLLKIFSAVMIITLILAGGLVLGVFLFSDQILWVFGEDYAGLNYELFLVAISNSFTLLIGVSSKMTVGRGWYLRPAFLIGLNFISTVISIAYLDMSELTGVLYFNIVVAAVHLCLMIAYGLYMINRTRKNPGRV
jgi:O-antigen/teichoic acid export membrane protein